MLDVNIVHELRHKAKRADSNESDDNEKYLIWYSYACLVARKDRKRKEIFLPNISIKKNFFFFFQLKTVAHASFLINFHYAPFIEQFSSSESNLFKCKPWKRANNFESGMLQIISSRDRNVEDYREKRRKVHNFVTVHHRAVHLKSPSIHSWYLSIDCLDDDRLFTQIKVN